MALMVVILTAGICSVGQAVGTTFPRSQKVALIPNDGYDSSAGILPTSGTVIGRDGESFDQFDFTDLAISDIDPATLSNYDTVVLNEVNTSDLDAAARQELSAFVNGGGKLIIHDSDATNNNDYSWLPAPATTGQSCPDCGETGGSSTVVENNTMVSANPSDASYVNVAELPDNTDAVGDANLMVSQD